MRNSVLRIACSIAVVAGVTGQASATDSRNFNVTFKECTEFVGVTPVDRVKAAALVPNQFKVARLFSTDATKASIVVRVSRCKSVSVDGGPGKRGTVAHIGINIESPDLIPAPAGNVINNYTVTYASDSQELVEKLQLAGVPAEFDRNLTYEFSPMGKPEGELYAAITTDSTPHWFVHGNTGELAFGPMPFFANWWRSGGGYSTKMASTFPSISFFDASGVSLFTARSNLVGNLIGGNKMPTFSELPVRGVFYSAEMRVTVQD